MNPSARGFAAALDTEHPDSRRQRLRAVALPYQPLRTLRFDGGEQPALEQRRVRVHVVDVVAEALHAVRFDADDAGRHGLAVPAALAGLFLAVQPNAQVLALGADAALRGGVALPGDGLHARLGLRQVHRHEALAQGVGCAFGQVVGMHAAQFAPGADWRAADLLELPNAPGAGPGFDALAAGDGVVAEQVLPYPVAVDVLGNVLDHVADGRTLVPVDPVESHPMLLCAWFVGVVLVKKILPHDPLHGFGMGDRHEQQGMPVRGAVVLGFSNAKAVPINASASSSRTSPRPTAREVSLSFIGSASIKTGVVHHPAIAAGGGFVKPAWAGRRDHHADVRAVLRDQLETGDAGEQFDPANRLVRGALRGQVGKGVVLAVVVHRDHVGKHRRIARVLGCAALHRVVACVQAGRLPHQADADGAGFDGAGVELPVGAAPEVFALDALELGRARAVFLGRPQVDQAPLPHHVAGEEDLHPLHQMLAPFTRIPAHALQPFDEVLRRQLGLLADFHVARVGPDSAARRVGQGAHAAQQAQVTGGAVGAVVAAPAIQQPGLPRAGERVYRLQRPLAVRQLAGDAHANERAANSARSAARRAAMLGGAGMGRRAAGLSVAGGMLAHTPYCGARNRPVCTLPRAFLTGATRTSGAARRSLRSRWHLPAGGRRHGTTRAGSASGNRRW